MLLGIDICSTARIKEALSRSPFLRQEIFSADELAYADQAVAPEERLAARWAAKEACLKAFGLSVMSYDLSQLEVVHEPSGKPSLQVRSAELHADMVESAGRSDYDIQLSISHERDAAVAAVVVTP